MLRTRDLLGAQGGNFKQKQTAQRAANGRGHSPEGEVFQVGNGSPWTAGLWGGMKEVSRFVRLVCLWNPDPGGTTMLSAPIGAESGAGASAASSVSACACQTLARDTGGCHRGYQSPSVDEIICLLLSP